MKQPFTLSRRDFILLGGAATASVLTGCITNPVTGRSQLMLVSEQQEIEIDRENIRASKQLIKEIQNTNDVDERGDKK